MVTLLIYDEKVVARTAYPRSCTFIYLALNLISSHDSFFVCFFFVRIICKRNSLTLKMNEILEKLSEANILYENICQSDGV